MAAETGSAPPSHRLQRSPHAAPPHLRHGARHDQFGSPVGVNQAVKHHLADVGKAIEFARPMVYRAGWSLSAGAPDAVEATSMAKALASDAVDLACRSSLQCHGAIAYTVEYDLQLWLKRGWAMAAAWGTAAYHRDMVARALGF